MKTKKKYYYDSTFFKKLFEERKIVRTDLVHVLGIKNFSDINGWLDGKPIKIDHIIRICNYYDVSLDSFYPDANNIKEVDVGGNQEEISPSFYMTDDGNDSQTIDHLKSRLEAMARETAAQIMSKESEVSLLREQIAQMKITMDEMRENKKIQRELIDHLKENQKEDYKKSGIYLSEDSPENNTY